MVDSLITLPRPLQVDPDHRQLPFWKHLSFRGLVLWVLDTVPAGCVSSSSTLHIFPDVHQLSRLLCPPVFLLGHFPWLQYVQDTRLPGVFADRCWTLNVTCQSRFPTRSSTFLGGWKFEQFCRVRCKTKLIPTSSIFGAISRRRTGSDGASNCRFLSAQKCWVAECVRSQQLLYRFRQFLWHNVWSMLRMN